MLEEIKVRNNPRFRFSDKKTFIFKPGLNLIVGANTSGKSSLLEIIKTFYAYNDSWGNPYQNLEYYNNIHLQLKENHKATVKGKLNKVFQYKPQELKESRSLDYLTTDIKTALLSNFQSYGEGRKSYHEWFVDYITKNYKFNQEEISVLKEKSIDFDKFLTIIADEPENSMAINMQFGLFEWFLEWCQATPNLQIIIASHSIAAFAMATNPNVNVIEMNNGWVDLIKNKCKILF